MSVALLVVLGLVAPLWGPAAPATARPLANEALSSLAMLVTQLPEVRWTANGGGAWETVPDRRTVQEGDRVQTGPGAEAHLVYFEGSSTVVGPETDLVVQRLASTASGNIVTRVFQAVGSTVSYVRHLVDPAASFEVETPAALVFVRGTIPRVQVARSGLTRVRNEPDRPDSLVGVRGNDPARTVVILLPGQETEVVPGQPPSPPHWPGGTVRPVLPTTSPPALRPLDLCSLPGVACQAPSLDPCRWPGVTCNPPQPDLDPCPRASAGCQPNPPSPDPCQRPNTVCDPPRPDPCPRAVPACRPPLSPSSGPSSTTPTIERGIPAGSGQPGLPGQPGAPGSRTADQRPPIRLPGSEQGQTTGSTIR